MVALWFDLGQSSALDDWRQERLIMAFDELVQLAMARRAEQTQAWNDDIERRRAAREHRTVPAA